jgi:hypothetical protein
MQTANNAAILLICRASILLAHRQRQNIRPQQAAARLSEPRCRYFKEGTRYGEISDNCVCGRTGDIIQRAHSRIQINLAEHAIGVN